MLIDITIRVVAVILVGAGIWLFVWLTAAPLRREEKIRAANVKAWATLITMSQTMRMGGGQFYMQLTLDVQPPGDWPRRYVIEDRPNLGWNLRPGDQVQVYFNPLNHDQILLDKLTPPQHAAANKRP